MFIYINVHNKQFMKSNSREPCILLSYRIHLSQHSNIYMFLKMFRFADIRNGKFDVARGRVSENEFDFSIYQYSVIDRCYLAIDVVQLYNALVIRKNNLRSLNYILTMHLCIANLLMSFYAPIFTLVAFILLLQNSYNEIVCFLRHISILAGITANV